MATPPSVTSPPKRRLSARRGSVSAPDPFAAWAVPPSLSASSKLTIVRVPPEPTADDVSRAHRRGRKSGHGRHGSSASIDSNTSPRLSFACSSFGAVVSNSGPPRPGSPSLSRTSHRRSGSASSVSSASFKRLTPEQICDLAKHACSPHTTPVTSPVLSPTSFTPLADDVYLPFLDRPAEVAILIANPSTAKLLALLAQTLSRPSLANFDAADPQDARGWTYKELCHWFTHVGRDIADDRHWVQQIRRAVLPRNELIWERLKGILGIPPELDVDAAIDDLTLPRPHLSHDADADAEKTPLSVEAILTQPAGPSDSLADISEDAPPPDASVADVVQGLRIMTTPTTASHDGPLSPGTVRPRTTSGNLGAPYDALSERGPGNPIFPSSFARLAMRPTLRANRPVTRGPPPPMTSYPHFLRPGSGYRGRGSKLSEYALTTASGSSVSSIVGQD